MFNMSLFLMSQLSRQIFQGLSAEKVLPSFSLQSHTTALQHFIDSSWFWRPTTTQVNNSRSEEASCRVTKMGFSTTSKAVETPQLHSCIQIPFCLRQCFPVPGSSSLLLGISSQSPSQAGARLELEAKTASLVLDGPSRNMSPHLMTYDDHSEGRHLPSVIVGYYLLRLDSRCNLTHWHPAAVPETERSRSWSNTSDCRCKSHDRALLFSTQLKPISTWRSNTHMLVIII
ncbi:hypothetical protein QBC43DRAFT_43501 [Cladorrhinum sp. PSN259]|nr:hypothetical protein QBC43DRAFT_43501 [Cladorrhinum sp. PSN259]